MACLNFEADYFDFLHYCYSKLLSREAQIRKQSQTKVDFDEYMKSGKDTFIIFDIETTGLYPETCGITEIGAVKVKGGEILGEFSTYVNPERPIPPESTRLTGISDETVKGAPKIGEALRDFFDFAGENTLVAHNAEKFEMPFMKKYAVENKIRFDNPYIDTLNISRKINKDLKNHTLKSLVKFYKIEDFKHDRAVDAARVLAVIFLKMKEVCK